MTNLFLCGSCVQVSAGPSKMAPFKQTSRPFNSLLLSRCGYVQPQSTTGAPQSMPTLSSRRCTPSPYSTHAHVSDSDPSIDRRSSSSIFARHSCVCCTYQRAHRHLSARNGARQWLWRNRPRPGHRRGGHLRHRRSVFRLSRLLDRGELRTRNSRKVMCVCVRAHGGMATSERGGL